MKDKSLFNNTNDTERIEYINECVREVCINGDDLSKYEKMIGKLFPEEEHYYAKVQAFINQFRTLSNKQAISDTSIANIKYIAKDVHVTDDTICCIFSDIKDKRQRKAEEERKRKEAESKRFVEEAKKR